MNHRAILHDPDGRLGTEATTNRAVHTQLVKQVLTWDRTGSSLPPDDYQQIALQLTGHARLVAAELRHRTCTLPADSPQLALNDIVLDEADRRLSTPSEGTAHCAQSRARLVQALYERLDRFHAD